MPPPETGSLRTSLLQKFFHQVVHGNRELNSLQDGQRFLEALSNFPDASKGLEKLIACPRGMAALAQAFRFSGDQSFLNAFGADALLFFSDSSFKKIHNGQFLRRALEAIVDPPTFWMALVDAHERGLLTGKATQAFAWLLLEIISTQSPKPPDVRIIAERFIAEVKLTESLPLDTRNLVYRIERVLQTTSTDTLNGAGGRHDNDFANFRQIAIIPTPDEFASTVAPFYRRADAVDTLRPELRGAVHLDNQFRLLREDFLGELRNDVQIATGQKKGFRRITNLPDLVFDGIECGSEKRREPCSLRFQCCSDVSLLARTSARAQREKILSENPSFMRHQSFGCLMRNGSVVAFASVLRDQSLLAQKPPVVVLTVADEGALQAVLLACRSEAVLQFLQVGTAVFAYQPVLKCLQTVTELPLQDDLLGLLQESKVAESVVQPRHIAELIRQMPNAEIQSVLNTTKSVKLDESQTDSLLAGLERKVSVIQGPPGTSTQFTIY